MSDALAFVRLGRTHGVGSVAFRRLMGRYADPNRALEALPDLARAGGSASLTPFPREEAEREIAAATRLGGTFLFLGQPGYPVLLALLDDAPPILTIQGDPAVFAAPTVAIVGSRNASSNGSTLAHSLAAELAGRGTAIVSGMARGIDTAAHEGALTAGRTIACVAGGLDQPYPPENAALQARIAGGGGCVVAEAPLGTAPMARHFPKRNRVIAGLSLGVLVVEAAARSGSLITARVAQDADRELFAVPGSPLDPRCRGSNGLIRDGAHLVETAADVLDHLPDDPRREGLGRVPMFRRNNAAGFDEPAADWIAPDPATDFVALQVRLLELMGPSPTSVDDLVRRCQFSAAAVQSVLLELELAGRVEMLPGNRAALLIEPEVHHLRP